jgi:hypothetical protein
VLISLGRGGVAFLVEILLVSCNIKVVSISGHGAREEAYKREEGYKRAFASEGDEKV